MTEENKDKEPVVSDKEIADVEKSLLSKEKAKDAELMKTAEAKVRKEIESEQKLKGLEAENKKFEEIIKKQAEEKETIKNSKDEELKKLQEEIGSSKALRPNDSPFAKTENTKVPKEKFVDNLSDDDMSSVDEESLNAFLESHGMSKNQWKGSR